MILVFADLKSPLIYDRISILKRLNEQIILVHNADGYKLSKEVYVKYNSFKIIEHLNIKLKYIRYMYSVFFTLFLLFRYRPKLIVIHWASRIFQSLAFLFLSKRIIVSTMGSDINKEVDANGIKYAFTNILLKASKIITVKSNHMKSTILKNFPAVNKNKIEIINWGVDKRFATKSKDKKLLEKLNISHDKKVFLCLRRMSNIYHKHEILKTFLNYKEKNNVSDVIIISTMSSYNNNPYYKELLSIANTSKYKQDIIFVDIKHKDIHKYISISDVVVSFSKTDGLSQSLMESVMANKFCITFDNENHKDIIKNKVNGYYFKNIDTLEEAFSFKFDIISNNYAELLDKEKQTKKYLNVCKNIILQGR